MDIYEARRAFLQALIDGPRFKGSKKNFAADAGINPTYLTRMLKKDGEKDSKKIGEEIAISIQERLGLPFGALLLPGWKLEDVSDQVLGRRRVAGGDEELYGHTVVPIRTWEDLMSLIENLPDKFSIAVPDEALAPRLKSTQTVILEKGLTPRPGDFVLVQDRTGGVHLRAYRKGVGRWEAHAENIDYQSMDSDRDGLIALAVVVGVTGRWG